MKRIIYLLAVLPLFFLWGCSGDDDGFQPTPPEAGNQIKFEIGFAPQNDGKPQTRVATAPDFTSTWENGDKIGIFAVKRASGDTKALAATDNYMHNVKLTYSTADGGKWTTASELWHASGSEVLDFYAYYPYQASVDPTAFTFTVQTDQNGTAYNQSDLLMAKKGNVVKSSNVVSLQFAHALSLVQVEFESGGRGANIDALAKVTMKATTTTKPFSLSATSIEASAEAASDIVMTKVAGLTNTYRALVPAQTIAADKTLFAVTRGDRLVYTTSTETTLAQDKAARYKVTLIAPTIDPNHTYAVGDRYPYVGLTEGIVYEINNAGKNGKIVSLDEGTNKIWTAAGTWCTDKGTSWYLPAKEELKALYAGYSGNEDISGWDDFCSMPGYSNQACIGARATFNSKLSAAGGTGFSSNKHWSSSESGNGSAWIVDFNGGYTSADFKDTDDKVRAVSAF